MSEHDPLCPQEKGSMFCLCEVIQQTRSDERNRVTRAVKQQEAMWKEDTLTRMGIGIALAAIKELE